MQKLLSWVRSVKLYIPVVLIVMMTGYTRQENLYFTDSGHIKFSSNAPLEFIQASSNELAGILNINDLSFSFTVSMVSFQGFNSALQRTHFNENYIESEKFPNSTFNGKIIEEIDFASPGTYHIRAKGLLNVHGVDNDKIIRCTIQVETGRISVESSFKVPLDEHKIKIPSIVQQKIAEVIDVSIRFEMEPMNP
ncbi:MAG: YceI family protein [Bacteroidales bacterium]|nr:YceI family protein [Bacteroidales bacterium]